MIRKPATNFYPRSPCGERPIPRGGHISKTNFYPRSPCGERRLWDLMGGLSFDISIHALLAESDLNIMLYNTSSLIFLSTLSLRRATKDAAEDAHYYIFLSTLSLRRATTFSMSAPMLIRNFYPRSPCGERPVHLSGRCRGMAHFYPRSPCGERRWLTNMAFM